MSIVNLTDVADGIVQNGQSIVLRRPGPHSTYFDVVLPAMVRAYQPQELVGGITQGDRRVVISDREITAAQWPGPPRQGDQLLINGKTATLQANAATILVGDFVVKHIMQVRG